MHKPIQFHDFTLSLPHKTCFSNFNGRILFGDRIAIIGRNGAGKSTLLKQLHDPSALNDDVLTKPRDLRTGYLPQIIETSNTLSGGERINKALTHALLHDPDLLLLDEPTNHLDASNRRSLMNLLRRYTGTLVIVSHDVELLRHTIDTFWHIENEKIHIFKGRYDDYVREHQQKHINIEEEIAELKQQQKGIHTTRMQEQ